MIHSVSGMLVDTHNFVHLLLSFEALSYNQPRFCWNASWKPNATTFASSSIIGQNSSGMFVDTNNTLYVAGRTNNRILVWREGNVNFTRNLSGGLNSPVSLFVKTTGGIYVGNSNVNGRVDMWTWNGTNSTSVMYPSQACYGLFIDINNSLYCSIYSLHQVAKNSLNNYINTPVIVAGTGCSGSTSNTLNNPAGIFVDVSLNLYVADSGNNRIQFFTAGELNAKTIVINGSTENITLSRPTGIVLDADGYLFIVDQNNHRIVGSGPNGFRCLVGCSKKNGSGLDQLKNPFSLSFDSYGNMFVADSGNNRVQKFILVTNSCSKHYNKYNQRMNMNNFLLDETMGYQQTTTSTRHTSIFNLFFIEFC